MDNTNPLHWLHEQLLLKSCQENNAETKQRRLIIPDSTWATDEKILAIRRKLKIYRYVNDKSIGVLEKKFSNLTLDNSIGVLEKKFSNLTLDKSKSKDSSVGIKVHTFRNSTSSFNISDMEVLSIVIKEITQLGKFLGYSQIPVETEEKETLYEIAERIGESECRRFDLELKRVFDNNKQKENCYFESQNESYVDSLADTIFRISNIYDGKYFELLRPKNNLYICGKKYGSSADRELRVIHTGMVFMIEESKHVNTSSCLKGDLQLACNLIVSHQQNRTITNNSSLKPLSTVFAMKMVSTEVFLYFMNYDEEYLDYLEKGTKKKEITLYKFSHYHGSMNILYEDHMRHLFNVISNIGEAILEAQPLN
jgi:hypothetical protein